MVEAKSDRPTLETQVWVSEGNRYTHIRCKIKPGNLPLLKNVSPFKDVPNCLTLLDDPTALVELTSEQVNVLADLSCWNVTENADLFRSLLPACP